MIKILSFTFLIIFAVLITQSKLHSQTWKELYDSTNAYMDKKDYKTALEFGKKALPLAEKEFGKLDSNYTNNLGTIADLCYYMRELDSALFYCKETLNLCRVVYNSDHQNLAEIINNMGFFYSAIGDKEKAELFYKESLEMSRRLFKTDHPDLATYIWNMGHLYFSAGDYEKAKPYYIETLEMRRRLFKTDHPNLAKTINNVGDFYSTIGDYEKAEPLYKEALEMRRRLFKTDHPGLAKSISSMGYFYRSIGDYEKAEPLFKEALEMRRRMFKTDHPDLARSINNMASFYGAIKDYEKAEPLYKEALDMTRRIFKTDHPGLARSINNMGHFYRETRDYEKAEPLLKESLEMYRRIYKKDHPNLALSIINMGTFYSAVGEYEKAEPFYKEALEMSRRIYNKDHEYLAKSIINLTSLYCTTGNFEKAEPLFDEALSIYKAYYNRNSIFLSLKEKKQFWFLMKQKFQQYNSFALKRSNENPKILAQLYDNILFRKNLLFNSLGRLKKRILKSGDSVLIAKYNRWTKEKEILLKLYSKTDEEAKKMGINVDSIEVLTNDLEKELSLKSEEFKQSYENKKVSWKNIQLQLLPDEAAVEVVRFRKYGKGWNKVRPDVKVDIITDTLAYAFLIVNEKTVDHPDLVVINSGRELEKEYYNYYRNSIKNETEDKKSFPRYWEKLHEKLKVYKKIYFSADGIYNKINPGTFLLPDGKFLIEEYDIELLNSTKDILLGYYRTKQESNIYNSAVLIGNPNFSLSEDKVKEVSVRFQQGEEEDKLLEPLASIRGIKLTKLPSTEKEIKDVEKFLESRNWDVKSYLGDSAVKSALKSINSPRVLHIATHGLFLEDAKGTVKNIFGIARKKMAENPLLRSGLFFTGAENYLDAKNKSEGEENGILTAYEAMNLNLDRTELVVLSACETGLGEVQNGEGVFGLRRAFQTAGAKTVIMSLWTVSDKATQLLMSDFYENWITGMTKREAFIKAQLEVKKKYKYPYYWGAFVMVGE